MNLLSFGLKNMGTIKSLFNGVGVLKQFLGNNNGFTHPQFNNPYMNPYNPYINQYNHQYMNPYNQYMNHNPHQYYNHNIPPYQNQQQYNNNMNPGFNQLENLFRSLFRQ